MVIARIPPGKPPDLPAAKRIIASNRELIRLLSTGLRGQVYIKRWKVLPRRTGLGCVTYGKKAIFGFNANNGDVFSIIKEEGSEIVARFYNSPEKAEQGRGLLKTVVLSRKTGQKRWCSLDPPEITFSRVKQQKQRLEAGRVKGFLLEEKEEGSKFETAPRKVLNDG